MITKTLKLGSIGSEVAEMQRILGINADGVFGPNTKKNVQLYQTLHNLGADGIVGQKTRDVMNANQPQVTFTARIFDMAMAIRSYEGWYPGSVSQKNNNPGNLRSWRTQIGTSYNGFAIFKSYTDGWNALVELLTRASKGLSSSYKPDFSLRQFFHVYAPVSDNNDSDAYAKFVARQLGITIDYKVKDLV